MKIPGISCEYKKLNEYLYWCGTITPPVLTQSAKNNIIMQLKPFVKKLNDYCTNLGNKITASLKTANPQYNTLNNQSMNWSIFAYCFNAIKKKIKTGEFYFDINKFENDFANNYVSEKAKQKILELYVYCDSPQIQNAKEFSWVLNHIQGDIQTRQYYNNGEYVGTMDLKNVKRHGTGTYTWKNGDKYVGRWQNGTMHGQGEYFYNEKSSLKHYVGNWHNGNRSGKGVLTYKSGSKYTGLFRNNNRHGCGDMDFSSGNSYSGIWENDKMSVLGRYDYANGDCYIGAFKDDKFNGFGVLFYNDESVTFGYFEDDEATSNSTTRYSKTFDPYYDDPAFKYQEYENGQYFAVYKSNGYEHGVFMWNNDNSAYSKHIYLGDFYNEECDGYGVYLFSDQCYYKGEFCDGNMEGNGCMYYNDGTHISAYYKNDKPCEPIKRFDMEGKLL